MFELLKRIKAGIIGFAQGFTGGENYLDAVSQIPAWRKEYKDLVAGSDILKKHNDVLERLTRNENPEIAKLEAEIAVKQAKLENLKEEIEGK